jgi:protein transport protein YIF1
LYQLLTKLDSLISIKCRFSPEALSYQFTRGILGWFIQVALLKSLLYSMGGGEAALLDIVAYGGYLFTGLSLAIVVRMFWSLSYYFLMPWLSICMGVFLVKTMKRVLLTEMRSHDKHSSRQHYMLLFMAVAQFPLFFWLGNVRA